MRRESCAMASSVTIALLFLAATLKDSNGQAHYGFSQRYEYGSRGNHYSRPSTPAYGGYGGYGSGVPAASHSKPSLQHQFLNLFNQNGVGAASASCSPRLIGDLSGVRKMCSRDDFFFGMNPRHIDAVQTVTGLMSAPYNPEESLCVASQLKNSDDVNQNVWIRSLMSTVLHSPELSGLQRPSMVEVFPSMLIHSEVMDEAKRLAGLPPNVRGDGCIVLDGSYGTQNGVENALWYWREDVMMNSHHWYWHLANPFMPMAMPGQQPPRRPDRRGELFSYMHQSLLARYHSERLSNGLGKIVPLDIEPSALIEEPYYANLDGTNSGQRWTDRPPNTRIQDIFFNRIPDTPMNITIGQRTLQLNRILESVASGRLVTPTNQILALNNRNGIDFLAEVVEASVYSINPGYYGGFGIHNDGHFLLALIQDPQGRRRLPPGVMAEAATAMRDPIFYRYHVPIAKLLDTHKHYLPPYHPTEGEFPLLWTGVHVETVQMIPLSQRPNEMTTYWNHATYDLSRGLDFNRSVDQGQNPINVCLRHLDYEHFEYQISITKDPSVSSKSASIRIFLAPRFDENGRPYSFFDQRTLFFVLDYFTVRLEQGQNLVRRRSIDSSLTISWPQRLEELERDMRKQTPDCGCGFPQHLLLPKGRQEGMMFDLFVMATNAEDDAVPFMPNPMPGGKQRPASCVPAPVYCGVPGQLYPDSKPMGYPFDRLPYSVHDAENDGNGGVRYSETPRMVNTIQEYTNGLSNAALAQVRITHLDS